ncbi:MAG: LppP/LprE family lipoprotein [Microcystaceae cyanobacterium]
MLLKHKIGVGIIAFSLFHLSSMMVSANPVEEVISWLEQEKPQNWNQAGASIPQAPKNDEYSNLERCGEQARQPSTPEDQALVKAGWTLFGPIQVYGKTTLRSAMSNADGMCRPMGYQEFVFVEGKFAGTLSPIPMSSRTDGSAIRTYIPQENRLTTVFNRYSATDALCCPSRTNNVSYTIEYQKGKPVVIPQQIY